MDNKCCICGFECNPSSQSCGSCAREVSAYSLGWIETPKIADYLVGLESDSRPVVEPSEITDKIKEKY